MLATIPEGVKLSPRPVASFNESLDPFYGGYKFAYLAIEQKSIPNDDASILQKIKRLISAQQTACIVIGRVLTNRKALDIGAIEYPKCDPRAIIDHLADLAFKYNITEVFTDLANYQWLTQNQFWFSYCAQREQEIAEEQELAVKEKKPYLLTKSYGINLMKIKRNPDPAFRLSEFSTAYEQGRIGLVPSLREDQQFLDSLANFQNLILCDAIGGILLASNRYR